MTNWFDKLGNELNAIRDEALRSLTDKPNDKTVDTVYVDDPDQRVFVCQSKFDTS